MSSEAFASTSSHELCDVLRIVPLDVITANIWANCNRRDRGHLRQTSKAALQVCNLLRTSLCLTYTVRGEHSQAWNTQFAQRITFLGRLPRLTSLQLHDGPDESSLVFLLTLCGDATQGRVTRLTLEGRHLSIATTRVVRLICPNLHRLDLDRSTVWLPSTAALCGNLIEPLLDLPLTHVSSGHQTSTCACVCHAGQQQCNVLCCLMHVKK